MVYAVSVSGFRASSAPTVDLVIVVAERIAVGQPVPIPDSERILSTLRPAPP